MEAKKSKLFTFNFDVRATDLQKNMSNFSLVYFILHRIIAITLQTRYFNLPKGLDTFV